jgi:hypothetical protein
LCEQAAVDVLLTSDDRFIKQVREERAQSKRVMTGNLPVREMLASFALDFGHLMVRGQ